ncbi:hypothetical protein IKD98_02350 [Candidatus Saccharibacteria bacterium]|nr:hypothetical protein [Candidatus Saccharibacteria bacterium]
MSMEYSATHDSLRASAIIGALIAIVIVSGTELIHSTVFADTNTVDKISVTIPISCTMEGAGMNTHNATINNGQYNSAIGETTLTTFCNDASGFAIYAIGYTDNEEGKNVLANATLGSSSDIVTGTAISGTISNWAMKLTTISSPSPSHPITIESDTEGSFSSFHTIPDDYTLVAKRTSATDVGIDAEGSSFKTSYQTYISSTQPAGTYIGRVKYVLIHPNDGAKPEKPVTIATAEYLQDVNACPADLPEEIVYTLKDSRDEQEYKVAKLKDGRCWMVENLNIAGGAALSSEDTDFDSNYILPTTGNWTVSDGKLILPASAIKNTDNNDLIDNTQFSVDNYAYVFNSGNRVDCGNSGQNVPCYSYYSWDVATVGSGRSISTDDVDADHSVCPKNWRLPNNKTSDSFDAAIAAESDFYNLAINYGMSTGVWNESSSGFFTQAGPNTNPSFLLNGLYGGGSLQFSGLYGTYWSSTSSGISTNLLAGIFLFDANNVSLSAASNRRNGLPIRCVLKYN